jgi:hypothetical protein
VGLKDGKVLLRLLAAGTVALLITLWFVGKR